MPRIPREEHAAILQRVDVEGQKVAEVAAAYGCTPANIYAILARLRREGAKEVADIVQERGDDELRRGAFLLREPGGLQRMLALRYAFAIARTASPCVQREDLVDEAHAPLRDRTRWRLSTPSLST